MPNDSANISGDSNVSCASRTSTPRRSTRSRRSRRTHRSYQQSAIGSMGENFDESIDIMGSLGNLMDAMLVFSCGLIVSIVAHWNVDLSVTEVVEQEQMTQVEQIDQITQDVANGSRYSERGTVVEDSETGDLYLIEPNNTGQTEQKQ